MIESYLDALETRDITQTSDRRSTYERCTTDWKLGGVMNGEAIRACHSQSDMHLGRYIGPGPPLSKPPPAAVEDAFGYRGTGNHHNLIMKLVERLQKYDSRGIKINGVKPATLTHDVEFASERF
jgi:hypothetical protein